MRALHGLCRHLRVALAYEKRPIWGCGEKVLGRQEAVELGVRHSGLAVMHCGGAVVHCAWEGPRQRMPAHSMRRRGARSSATACGRPVPDRSTSWKHAILGLFSRGIMSG
jgi:hypothetical protein